MFEIAEWHERYEVNSRGGAAVDGDKLRAGPLNYIRHKCHGRQQGIGYRKLLKLAGKKAMGVYGIFCKFLEISGDAPAGKRGTLWNERDKPAGAKDLAFILGVPETQIVYALGILTSEELGWLKHTNSGIPVNSRKLPEIPPSVQYSTDHINTEEKKARASFKKPTLAATDLFDQFWQAYPRKKAKGYARERWDKLRPSKELTERMIAAIAQQRESTQWKKDKGEFIPYPATWLKRGCWDDEPVKVAANEPLVDHDAIARKQHAQEFEEAAAAAQQRAQFRVSNRGVPWSDEEDGGSDVVKKAAIRALEGGHRLKPITDEELAEWEAKLEARA